MAIREHHIPDFGRMGPYIGPPMLMLGSQQCVVDGFPSAASYFGQWVGESYEDLDLDGGTLPLDLNADLGALAQRYATVFNLGTLEHVWNAHQAWVNALRAVKVGGHLLSHGPANGWVNHGIHQTNPAAIVVFVEKNGFEIVDQWLSKWRNQGDILWFIARKIRHIERVADYEPPMQIYEAGTKTPIG